jgi:hypothetical protein
MQKLSYLTESRLYCHVLEYDNKLFFSLVDYRNSLFTSNNPDKIIDFYNGFKDRDELIEWMRERPKGANYLYEVEGNKDIIVVITTADYNGRYALNCREAVFKGLFMIFVESGGRDDYYFNYAYNSNLGIKKALEYNPKWIVLSNDDVYKIDEISVLQEKLMNLDNEKYDVVFTIPSRYHSIPVFFGEQNALRKLYFCLRSQRLKQLKIETKFNVTFFSSPIRGTGAIFFKHTHRHLSIASFGIFSSKFIRARQGILFDDLYVNSAEDIDLSLELTLDKRRYEVIDYRIGDNIGLTLGTNVSRKIRDVAGYAYLNYKIKEGKHPISYAVLNSRE